MSCDKVCEWADLIVVVGGDGTLLRAFHDIGGCKPFLGVNAGSIGYLMEISVNQVDKAANLITLGNYTVEERLSGIVKLGERTIPFLNEIVIIGSERGKLIPIKVNIDGRLIQKGRADGLIISTPTGSTAYAMSAGGPVVDPLLQAFVIVPLAPFSVLQKAIVVSASRSINVESDELIKVIVDGLLSFELESNVIEISYSPKGFKLIRLPLSEHVYNKLKRRLLDLRLSREVL
ncbi:MAG: NAD(+)/NADH kinase [Thermofilaceae archaeon]